MPVTTFHKNDAVVSQPLTLMRRKASGSVPAPLRPGAVVYATWYPAASAAPRLALIEGPVGIRQEWKRVRESLPQVGERSRQLFGRFTRRQAGKCNMAPRMRSDPHAGPIRSGELRPVGNLRAGSPLNDLADSSRRDKHLRSVLHCLEEFLDCIHETVVGREHVAATRRDQLSLVDRKDLLRRQRVEPQRAEDSHLAFEQSRWHVEPFLFGPTFTGDPVVEKRNVRRTRQAAPLVVGRLFANAPPETQVESRAGESRAQARPRDAEGRWGAPSEPRRAGSVQPRAHLKRGQQRRIRSNHLDRRRPARSDNPIDRCDIRCSTWLLPFELNTPLRKARGDGLGQCSALGQPGGGLLENVRRDLDFDGDRRAEDRSVTRHRRPRQRPSRRQRRAGQAPQNRARTAC